MLRGGGRRVCVAAGVVPEFIDEDGVLDYSNVPLKPDHEKRWVMKRSAALIH